MSSYYLLEWRIKYLNYKAGKKYVKAVRRAYNRANSSPRSKANFTPSIRTAQPPRSSSSTELPRHRISDDRESSAASNASVTARGALPIPEHTATPARESDALNRDASHISYGSFVPTPIHANPARESDDYGFSLPGPAIPTLPEQSARSHPRGILKGSAQTRAGQGRSASLATVPTFGTTTSQNSEGGHLGKSKLGPPSHLRRLFSHSPGHGKDPARDNAIGLQTFDLVREREIEFYHFMDSELDKVESFYKSKEKQAGERLQLLKKQLAEMRNRRIEEMDEARRQEAQAAREDHAASGQDKHTQSWVQPLKAKIFPLGPNSLNFGSMPRTPLLGASLAHADAARDYIRRPEDDDVSYRTAKRKLKLALQEFYRGLELLKSYALLNRTAFRKLNKKFDKAVNARPPFRYVNDKVNKAWFVESDALDNYVKDVEDMYARYFERGNHKLAAGRLRSLVKKSKDESGSSFLNGFMIGTGLVFAIQGTISGTQLYFHEDPDLARRTAYLMQIYGGYLLMLILFGMFCVNCFLWQKNKINYPFIFEFDQRHHLDWRRLAEFPSFFLLLFGVCVWVNFSSLAPDSFYLTFPVILVGITAVIIFLPGPFLAHRSRRWFVYSHVSAPTPILLSSHCCLLAMLC